MLDTKFIDWLEEKFHTFSYVGNPSSKKYRFENNVYGPKDLFTLIMDKFKPEAAEYHLKSDNPMHPELWTSNSEEANEAIKCLLGIAKKNKQNHAKSEKLRRQHGVLESAETVLSTVHDFPEEPSSVDEDIFSHFRQVIRGTTTIIYHHAGDGKLHAIGVVPKDSSGRAILAKKMKDCFDLALKKAYEDAGLLISGVYNDLQCLDPDEIQEYLVKNKMDSWPELKATWKRDIDSLVAVTIAHVMNNMPVLPWLVQSIRLCRETQEDWIEKDNGNKTKITHTSGFRFSRAANFINNAKSYYDILLQHTEYIKEIQKPELFGDIYKKSREVGLGDDMDWQTSPFLKVWFARHTENQIKVKAAFAYCLINRILTPSLLDMNFGGTFKNALEQLLAENAAKLYGCPQANVDFVLKTDALKSPKVLVQNDGILSHSYLDWLFVFYDEPKFDTEVMNNFKAAFGAKEPKVVIEPKYVDAYTETGFPVSAYLASNHPIQIYDKAALWRRLIIIRTDADNEYKKLSQEERKSLDDPEVRNRAFEVLMNMGRRAYEEISKMGFMDDINELFPDIGKEFNTASEDFEHDIREFYRTLFDGAELENGRLVIPVTEIIDKYYEFSEDKPNDGLEQKVLYRMRTMTRRNDKERIQFKGVRTMVYYLYPIEDAEADDAQRGGLRIQL
jgi:hypothetical protein